jgi:hypothetical protein
MYGAPEHAVEVMIGGLGELMNIDRRLEMTNAP